MSEFSDIRINPINGATSWRIMDPEILTISELPNVPGLYGFQLKDRPKAETVQIFINETGGEEFTIVTSNPAPGQVYIDFEYGFCLFNISDNGLEIITNSYEGGGSNANKKNILELVNLSSFSTSEINTNIKWIDNKYIYRKVIDIGNMPATGSKDVIHGIINVDNITKIYGIISFGDRKRPIPSSTSNINDRVGIEMRVSFVRIFVDNDISEWSGYVILEYTKT